MSSAPLRIHVHHGAVADLPEQPPEPTPRDRAIEGIGLLVEDAYRTLRDAVNEQRTRTRIRRYRHPRAA